METLSHFRNSCKNNPSVVWRPFWGCCWGFPRTIPRWPTAVAANGLNQLYRRLSGRASISSALRTGTTTKLPHETPTAAIRIQYLRSRLNAAVVKTHRRSLGILAKAARSNSLWVRVHGPTPHSARIKMTRECIWGATGLAKSKIALFLFKILWYDKHSPTHYTVLHWTIQI